ncbi:MAG: urease accessory protein UreD [Acidimicrobiia bacterium]
MNGVRAAAALAVAREGGRTVVRTLRSAPPLTLRWAQGAVHLVGTAAGPLGGDDLLLRIAVGPGARLVVRSVAASLVLPGPAGEASRLRVEVDLAGGAHLDLGLEPQIVAGGADHRATARVRMAEGATLRWRELTVLGRHGEEPGSLRSRLRVEREGRAVHDAEVAVGPAWPTSTGPGGLAGARALGTLVVLGPHGPGSGAWRLGPARGAVMELARGGWCASAVAPGAAAVAAWLDEAEARPARGQLERVRIEQ